MQDIFSKIWGYFIQYGLVAFGEKEELIFLGKEISEQRNYSEKIAERIDEEVAPFNQYGTSIAFKIAFNTLIKNNILLEQENEDDE